MQQKKLYMHLFVNRFVILYETPIRIYDMFVCVWGGGGGHINIFQRAPNPLATALAVGYH